MADELQPSASIKTDLLIRTDQTLINRLEYMRDVMHGELPVYNCPSVQGLREYFSEFFSHVVTGDTSRDEKAELTHGYKLGINVGCYLMEARFGHRLIRGYKDPTLIPGWIDAIGSADGTGWFNAGRVWTEADRSVDEYLCNLPELSGGSLQFARSAAGIIIASQNIQHAAEIIEKIGIVSMPLNIDPPVTDE